MNPLFQEYKVAVKQNKKVIFAHTFSIPWEHLHHGSLLMWSQPDQHSHGWFTYLTWMMFIDMLKWSVIQTGLLQTASLKLSKSFGQLVYKKNPLVGIIVPSWFLKPVPCCLTLASVPLDLWDSGFSSVKWGSISLIWLMPFQKSKESDIALTNIKWYTTKDYIHIKITLCQKDANERVGLVG